MSSIPTPAGTLEVGDGTARISFRRRLNHPVEAVWAAITDPDQRAEWFGPTETLEPRVGGRIETEAQGPPVSPAHRRVVGTILRWEPPHVFEHEWNQPIIEPSVVRYELRAAGTGTLLTFTHEGIGIGNARGFIPGTHAFLDRLTAHLDGAEPPEWGDRYAEVAPAYS